MDLSKIWIVQGAAARKTEDQYGTQQALEYLVGDKFFNFLEAADVAHLNHTRPVPHHRLMTAAVPPELKVRSPFPCVKHHLVMVARNRDKISSATRFYQLVKDAFRINASINIVAGWK